MILLLLFIAYDDTSSYCCFDSDVAQWNKMTHLRFLVGSRARMKNAMIRARICANVCVVPDDAVGLIA